MITLSCQKTEKNAFLMWTVLFLIECVIIHMKEEKKRFVISHNSQMFTLNQKKSNMKNINCPLTARIWLFKAELMSYWTPTPDGKVSQTHQNQMIPC